jgi:hypothetical protein
MNHGGGDVRRIKLSAAQFRDRLIEPALALWKIEFIRLDKEDYIEVQVDSKSENRSEFFSG